MSEPQEAVPDDRRYALWFGALLLDKGHVVELPNGRPELHVRTGRGVKKILLSIRDAPVDRASKQAVVGRVDDLEGDDSPHVVAILTVGVHDPDSFSFVHVDSTRKDWVGEGRDYTMAGDRFVDFARLDEWLNKLGRCE